MLNELRFLEDITAACGWSWSWSFVFDDAEWSENLAKNMLERSVTFARCKEEHVSARYILDTNPRHRALVLLTKADHLAELFVSRNKAENLKDTGLASDRLTRHLDECLQLFIHSLSLHHP